MKSNSGFLKYTSNKKNIEKCNMQIVSNPSDTIFLFIFLFFFSLLANMISFDCITNLFLK